MVIGLALAAASLFGVSSVLMHSKASVAPDSQSLRPGLLMHLAREPVWLAGVGAQLGGFGLQATALAIGSLALVQSLGPFSLLLAIPLAARLSGKRLRRSDWLGCLATVGGLATFIATAAPENGVPVPTALAWTVLLSVTLVATVVLVGAGTRSPGPPRALLFGAASGTMLAVTAALTKVVAIRFGQGLASGFESWECYALVSFGLVGILLMQSSYQAGAIEWSVPALTVTNPVVSIVIGITAFHEHLSSGGAIIPVLAAGLVVTLTGVVLLSRSPLILAIHE